MASRKGKDKPPAKPQADPSSPAPPTPPTTSQVAPSPGGTLQGFDNESSPARPSQKRSRGATQEEERGTREEGEEEDEGDEDEEEDDEAHQDTPAASASDSPELKRLRNSTGKTPMPKTPSRPASRAQSRNRA